MFQSSICELTNGKTISDEFLVVRPNLLLGEFQFCLEDPAALQLKCNQGGHGTGKTGNLDLTFSRQGKHREFCCNTGKVFETQGKYFLIVFIDVKNMFLFTYFQIFLASLRSA